MQYKMCLSLFTNDQITKNHVNSWYLAVWSNFRNPGISQPHDFSKWSFWDLLTLKRSTETNFQPIWTILVSKDAEYYTKFSNAQVSKKTFPTYAWVLSDASQFFNVLDFWIFTIFGLFKVFGFSKFFEYFEFQNFFKFSDFLFFRIFLIFRNEYSEICGCFEFKNFLIYNILKFPEFSKFIVSWISWVVLNSFNFSNVLTFRCFLSF